MPRVDEQDTPRAFHVTSRAVVQAHRCGVALVRENERLHQRLLSQQLTDIPHQAGANATVPVLRRDADLVDEQLGRFAVEQLEPVRQNETSELASHLGYDQIVGRIREEPTRARERELGGLERGGNLAGTRLVTRFQSRITTPTGPSLLSVCRRAYRLGRSAPRIDAGRSPDCPPSARPFVCGTGGDPSAGRDRAGSEQGADRPGPQDAVVFLNASGAGAGSRRSRTAGAPLCASRRSDRAATHGMSGESTGRGPSGRWSRRPLRGGRTFSNPSVRRARPSRTSRAGRNRRSRTG